MVAITSPCQRCAEFCVIQQREDIKKGVEACGFVYRRGSFSKLDNGTVACACVCLSGDRVRAGAFPRQVSGTHLRVPKHPGAWV